MHISWWMLFQENVNELIRMVKITQLFVFNFVCLWKWDLNFDDSRKLNFFLPFCASRFFSYFYPEYRHCSIDTIKRIESYSTKRGDEVTGEPDPKSSFLPKMEYTPCSRLAKCHAELNDRDLWHIGERCTVFVYPYCCGPECASACLWSLVYWICIWNVNKSSLFLSGV